jgi:hypothetical protein
LPLRHWAFAFWRVCASKKGVSALEIQRTCQITYKSALFLMHRVRFAVTDDAPGATKFTGTCEIDETYCGGKPRYSQHQAKGTLENRQRNAQYSEKVPIVAMVERGGKVRTKVVPNVTQKNVYSFIRANIADGSVVNTDQSGLYTILWPITTNAYAASKIQTTRQGQARA